ncbi:MAG: DnaJ domain-containing protein [Calothrix sp. MO_192.B10]|nr:DnaJ domain-containing protein [Calothrix sp. MO_192.B10]
MSQTFLHSEWLQQLVDPYAVLGISVGADEHQILRRYRSLARQLHPDRYHRNNCPDHKLAQAIFTRLINPAYEQIKSIKNRRNTIEIIRTQVEAGNLWKGHTIKTPIAREMIELSSLEADLFYEQAIASLASVQYKLLDRADQVTQQIRELNLVYLCLQRSVPLTEKSTALVPQVNREPKRINLNQTAQSQSLQKNYAQRHYQRAIDYVKQSNWKLAVPELRDAIKLQPQQSDYHALLGLVHLKQGLTGMARVYMRQALKLNPEHRLALKYALRLKITQNQNPSPISMAKAVGIAAIFSKLIAKKTS